MLTATNAGLSTHASCSLGPLSASAESHAPGALTIKAVPKRVWTDPVGMDLVSWCVLVPPGALLLTTKERVRARCPWCRRARIRPPTLVSVGLVTAPFFPFSLFTVLGEAHPIQPSFRCPEEGPRRDLVNQKKKISSRTRPFTALLPGNFENKAPLIHRNQSTVYRNPPPWRYFSVRSGSVSIGRQFKTVEVPREKRRTARRR